MVGVEHESAGEPTSNGAGARPDSKSRASRWPDRKGRASRRPESKSTA